MHSNSCPKIHFCPETSWTQVSACDEKDLCTICPGGLNLICLFEEVKHDARSDVVVVAAAAAAAEHL